MMIVCEETAEPVDTPLLVCHNAGILFIYWRRKLQRYLYEKEVVLMDSHLSKCTVAQPPCVNK